MDIDTLSYSLMNKCYRISLTEIELLEIELLRVITLV